MWVMFAFFGGGEGGKEIAEHLVQPATTRAWTNGSLSGLCILRDLPPLPIATRNAHWSFAARPADC